MEKSDIFSILHPRKENSSKRDYGKLLVIAGSENYRGAALLCCKAALKTGVGICCLGSVEKVIDSVAANIAECTFLPLRRNSAGRISAYNALDIAALSDNYSAVLLGCGLGLDDDTVNLTKILIQNVTCPLIIDADGLNAVSRLTPEILKSTKHPPVITPHIAEFSRLCSKEYEYVASHQYEAAKEFAEKYNCTVVLKSHVTVIANYDGKTAVNDKFGNSGLAKGGSGDILAGMVSSFVAQGYTGFESASAGVLLHAVSADMCAARLSKTGMLPSDILDDTVQILREMD